MPLTPFHLGPGIFFGLLLFRHLHLLTFLIANVIVDVEPLLVLLLKLDYPMHGFFHSFIGGSIVAVGLSLVMLRFKWGSGIMSAFGLEQEWSPKHVLLASFSGIYFHVLLDSMLYANLKPFYPLGINPFCNPNLFSGFEVYGFCLLCFLGGIMLYSLKRKRSG